MPPGGKPVQRMGGNADGQHPGKAQGRAGQSNGAHAAGPEISNDQKGAEEDHCRAEVIHQCQQPADHHRIGDEQYEVSLVHDPVHGRGSGIDKADLAELRRLQRQSADNEPVLCPIVLPAEQQGYHQESHTQQHR